MLVKTKKCHPPKKGENMSKTLKELERKVKHGYISDLREVEKIIDDFLDMQCLEISPGEPLSFEKDIAKGFDLDVENVRKCTLGDLLTIVGFEPSAGWFCVSKKEPWFASRMLGYEFCCAPSCFFLTCSLVKNKTSYNIRLFQHLQYSAFKNFIKTMETDEEKSKANRSWRYVEDYIRKAIPTKKLSDVTIGDVLDSMHKNGTVPWICGCVPIEQYTDKIVAIYRVAQIIFMECIRKHLITAGRNQFFELLEKCSPTGEIAVGFDIDFDNCYEM